MSRQSKHVFWFCSNRMYNSDAVYRATWWSVPFLLFGLIHRATCTVHGVNSVEDAREEAVVVFRDLGFSRQLMGEDY